MLALLLLLGVYDVVQRRRAVVRTYPALGHLRFLLEDIRPESATRTAGRSTATPARSPRPGLVDGAE